VQKCFGLPPGLAVMVYSPKAMELAQKTDTGKFYNGLLNIHSNAEKGQTTHTPNITNLYLLKRVMENRPGIEEIDRIIKQRTFEFDHFIRKAGLKPLIPFKDLRSKTVWALKFDPDHLLEIKKQAASEDILFGNGYGAWKENSLRMANFPAVTNQEIDRTKTFLQQVMDSFDNRNR
jgi:phosphoserine aminotransferase